MAQNVNLYGIVDTGYEWTKTKTAGTTTAKTAGLKSGTMAASRVGLRGTEDLGGGLRAGFQLEGAFTAGTGEGGIANFNRVSQLSVTSGLGTVAIGRNLRPYAALQSGFDVTGGASGHTTANLGTGRDNGIWYSNKFGDISVNAFVTTGRTGNPDTPNKASGHDVSVGYASGPLAVSFATFSGKRQTAAVGAVANSPGVVGNLAAAATNTKASGNAIGASYDLGVAKVFFSSLNTKDTNNVAGSSTKAKEMNLGVAVPMGATTLMAGYGTDTNTAANGAKSKAKDYVLGASYAFSKRTNAFALTSKNGAPVAAGAAKSGVTTTTVGLRHTF